MKAEEDFAAQDLQDFLSEAESGAGDSPGPMSRLLPHQGVFPYLSPSTRSKIQKFAKFLKKRRKIITKLIKLLVSCIFLYGLQKAISGRWLPISKIQELVKQKKLHSVTLGNFLIICYFKHEQIQ